MIRLKLEKADTPINQTNEYKDIGGLPVNLIIGNQTEFTGYKTIYLLGNNNFLELRFNYDTGVLSQIAFVCIGSVEEVDILMSECMTSDHYRAILVDAETVMEEIEYDMSVVRSGNQLRFSLLSDRDQMFYSLGSGLSVGLDDEGKLCSIILEDQNELLEEIDFLIDSSNREI